MISLLLRGSLVTSQKTVCVGGYSMIDRHMYISSSDTLSFVMWWREDIRYQITTYFKTRESTA